MPSSGIWLYFTSWPIQLEEYLGDCNCIGWDGSLLILLHSWKSEKGCRRRNTIVPGSSLFLLPVFVLLYYVLYSFNHHILFMITWSGTFFFFWIIPGQGSRIWSSDRCGKREWGSSKWCCCPEGPWVELKQRFPCMNSFPVFISSDIIHKSSI